MIFAVSDAVLASAVTGGLALAGVIWQSRKTRHVNSKEHGDSQAKLDRIESKVDRTSGKVDNVSDRLDDHIDKHHSRRKWF